MKRNFIFLLKTFLTAFSLFVFSTLSAGAYGVAPQTNLLDNLIGASGAYWVFSGTTDAELSAGDVMQFVLPQTSNMQPFLADTATLDSETGITLYQSMQGSPRSNRFADPSMENATTSWPTIESGDTAITATSTAWNGSGAIQITSGSAAQSIAFQATSTTPSTAYTASFYARGAAGGEIARYALKGGSCGPNFQYYNFLTSAWGCTAEGADLFASTSPYMATSSALTTSFSRITKLFIATSTAATSLIFIGGVEAYYTGQTVVYDAAQLETGGSATAFNLGGIGNPPVGISVGGEGRTLYGYATSTIPSGTAFTVTIGGINNAAGQLSMMNGMTWSIKAGTPSDPNDPSGVLSPQKISASPTADLTRAGGALISDNSSSITPSSYAISATSNYTFTITATSSIPLGGKIIVNFPTEFNINGITVPLQTINSASAQIAEGAFATSTQGGGTKKVILTTSNGATSAGDTITVVINGVVNPATADVYRPFYLYTAKANGGVLDGSYFGFENSDYGEGSPSPVDNIHIGGDNTLVVVVKKTTDGTTLLDLSAGERAQVKVGTGCPDKQFFVGERWLDDTGKATYSNILDCSYFVGIEPFDKADTSFYDAFLPPAMKSVSVSGGGISTTTLIFNVPDATVTLALTGGIAGQNAFVNAFNTDSQSFSEVFTTTGYTTPGFNGSGNGYVRLKAKSGSTWNFNLEGGQMGNQGNFSSGGITYWPPTLPSQNIVSGASVLGSGSFAYIPADKALVVSLVKSGTSDPVTDACIGVKRSGGGMFMGSQDTICQPNYTGNTYRFKVPLGTISVDVTRPGFGKPEEYPVGITSATTTKTISISSPTSYISVTVKDSNDVPINGAGVFANSSSGFGNAMTGSTGTTTIYVLPGTYTVQGFAPNFGPLAEQTAVVTGSSNPSVTFTVNTGTLKTISGTVTQGGNGLAGIKIGARGTGGTNGGNGTETDNIGNFTMYVPAGTYEVGGWSGDTGGLSPQNVNVSSANATGVNWALGGQGTLHFVIQNASTLSPLFAGAFDATSGRGNGTDTWTISGSDKVADIKLPAGDYEVHVGSPSFGEIANSTASITAGNTTTKTFNAAANATLVTLSGSVTLASVGVANVNVWASRINGPGFFSTQTDNSGNYSFQVPDERTYRVGAKTMGYVTNEGDVEVTASGAETQDFTLSAAGATITGTLKNTSAVAITNGWVSAKKIIGSNEVWTGSPTDASGNFSLDVDTGSTWTVYGEGPCYMRSAGTDLAAGSSANIVTLTAMNNCTPPTPQMNGVTAATGGQVAKNDLVLDIPANALGTGQGTISVSVSNAPLSVSTANATPLKNSVQSITATDSTGSSITSLNSNASISITYDPTELPVGFDESELLLGYFDTTTGQWEPVAATVDTVNNKITAQISHFTDYGPILPGVPDAPNSPAATAASASQIDLSWASSISADTYTIYRSLTDSDFTTAIITGVTGTTYSNTGLSASTKYYYKVAGVNSNGEGPSSDSVNATTNADAVAPSGGGSVGVAYLTPVANTIAATTTITTAAITTATATTPTSQISINAVFAKNLKKGMTSDDVLRLQKLLATDAGIYPEGLATGYFGSATERAVQRFQAKYGIVTSGTAATTGYGAFGPSTRAKIQEIFGRTTPISVPAQTVANPSARAMAVSPVFNGGMQKGTKGADVKRLQILLNSDSATQIAETGDGSPGNETSYFGMATMRAVQKFQELHGLAVPGDSGYGYVGPKTRAKLQEVFKLAE
jgi:peptidoglycan hydrolase-like protein with peptidoglycan-binding domain